MAALASAKHLSGCPITRPNFACPHCRHTLILGGARRILNEKSIASTKGPPFVPLGDKANWSPGPPTKAPHVVLGAIGHPRLLGGESDKARRRLRPSA